MLTPEALLPQAGSGYEAACAGKHSYPSENSARAVLAVLRREGEMRSGNGLDVYRCRYCGEWHHGHGSGYAGRAG